MVESFHSKIIDIRKTQSCPNMASQYCITGRLYRDRPLLQINADCKRRKIELTFLDIYVSTQEVKLKHLCIVKVRPVSKNIYEFFAACNVSFDFVHDLSLSILRMLGLTSVLHLAL